MTASEFVRQITAKHGVEVIAANGGVKVRNLKALPAYLQVTIAGHRHELQNYLVNGIDGELTDRHRAEALEAMGCYQILTEEVFDEHGVTQRWTWTHDRGDAYLAELLVGLLDVDVVAAERKQAGEALKEAEWSKQHPPRGNGLLGRSIGRIPGF